MNIAVLIKQVPDTETKASLTDSGLDSSNIKMILNPYDEFAIEEALIQKGKLSAEVTCITLGNQKSTDVLRTALAMGCDKAAHINVEDSNLPKVDTYLSSKACSELLKKSGPFDLILCGKQAIDGDSMAFPQMVAKFLEIPRVTVVSKLEIKPDTKEVLAERSIDGGATEKITTSLPCLISANKGLNKPRYASLPGIMKAKKKTIESHSLDDLGINIADQKVEYISFELPEQKTQGKILTGTTEEVADQLVKALRDEAKVI